MRILMAPFTALLLACSGGDSVNDDVLIFWPGMPVSEFNRQTFVRSAQLAMKEDFPDLASTQRPHSLHLIVNGTPVIFQVGSPNAGIFVNSDGGFIPGTEFASVSSIGFTIEPAESTFDDAFAMARRRCDEVRAAGLPDAPERQHAYSTYRDYGYTEGVNREFDDLVALRQYVLDPSKRIERIGICNLTDGSIRFSIGITNMWRVSLSHRNDVETNSDNAVVYRVKGDFRSTIPS